MQDQYRDDEMDLEFKAVMKAILVFLQNGETDRAVQYIQEILEDK